MGQAVRLEANDPSSEDVTAFERDGYFVTPKPILSEELIDRALYGVERYYQGERDWSLPISGGFLDWRPAHGGVLRINDYVSLQCSELREICCDRSIARIAGRLVGTSEIRLFHDQLITKLPTPDLGTAVGWHVDQAYWRTCSSSKMLTAWIPLVDLTDDMGGLAVVKGSHLTAFQDWMTTFNDQDLSALELKLSAAGIALDIETPVVPLGHVSFHHGRTVHGSRPNRGSKPRIALTVHFQDGENRYSSHSNPSGRAALHINDLLCRQMPDGTPDYRDPEICPVLWLAETST